MNYRDDFERFAHDIINAVRGGSWSGSAPQWQIEKIAGMLRVGPGVTVWPRDAAAAAQAARERVLRRPAPMVLPPVKLSVPKPLPLVLPLMIPPLKKP